MAMPPEDAALSTLRIGASLDDIARATQWLGDLAEAQDWPQALRFGLELSLEEALANVISYGFKGVIHAPAIRIACRPLPGGRVALDLVDNGIAFDPTTLAEPEAAPSVEEASIGGHGVQLMRHFLQELSYRREGEENHLTLIAAPAREG